MNEIDFYLEWKRKKRKALNNNNYNSVPEVTRNESRVWVEDGDLFFSKPKKKRFRSIF